MSKWQTIDTVPRELSTAKFLIFRAGGYYNGGCGRFWKDEKIEITSSYFFARMDRYEKEFVSHWMPLPEPPK